MYASDVKFSVAPVDGKKQLIGILDGMFDNDDQIAEYFRAQGRALLDYADRLDELSEKRRKRLEQIEAARVQSD